MFTSHDMKICYDIWDAISILDNFSRNGLNYGLVFEWWAWPVWQVLCILILAVQPYHNYKIFSHSSFRYVLYFMSNYPLLYFYFCGYSNVKWYLSLCLCNFRQINTYFIIEQPCFNGKVGICNLDARPDFVRLEKEDGLQMVKILNEILNPEAWTCEIWSNGSHLIQNHLKFGQNIPIFSSFFWLEQE